MKVQYVRTGAYATLNNGQKIFVPVDFHYESNTKDIDLKKLIDGAKLEYRTTYEVKTCGDVFKVGNHPATELCGVKYAENSIYKVFVFDGSISVYYLNKRGEEECDSIGYMYKESRDKFLADLCIKM